MTVMAQYVQLSTLAATDLLTFADDTYKPLTTAPHYMTTDSNTANDGEQAENDQTSTEARKEAFQAFLDDHAALSESPERRAVFSLGALIGHLSRYQDVSQTMADKYPVSNVTMMSLPRITAKTIDKDTGVQFPESVRWRHVPRSADRAFRTRCPMRRSTTGSYRSPTSNSITVSGWRMASGTAKETDDCEPCHYSLTPIGLPVLQRPFPTRNQ